MRIFGQFLGKKFQSNMTAKPQILGLVHHSHTTAPKHLEDSVVSEDFADKFRGDGHRRDVRTNSRRGQCKHGLVYGDGKMLPPCLPSELLHVLRRDVRASGGGVVILTSWLRAYDH